MGVLRARLGNHMDHTIYQLVLKNIPVKLGLSRCDMETDYTVDRDVIAPMTYG